MKKKDIEDEILPFLKELKEKGDGFKIPKGYFDAMEQAVLTRLSNSGDLGHPTLKVVKRPGLFPLSIRSRTATALAAALALILAAVWFIRQPAALGSLPFVSTELNEEDLESYVLENVHDFEPLQLVLLTQDRILEPMDEIIPAVLKKSRSVNDELNTEDLDEIINEMTDEELEQIL